MSDRAPDRLPASLVTNGFSSGTSTHSMDSEQVPSNSALSELLRQRLGLDAGENVLMFDEEEDEPLDYEPEDGMMRTDGDEDDEEDEEEIIFQEVDESQADLIGKDKFRTPGECMIKTAATIVVNKKSEDGVRAGFLPNDRPSLTQVRERDLLICIPVSNKKSESLRDRFARQNERMMRRDLTPEQKLLNYLRFRGEQGFKHVFKGTAGAKKKLAERVQLLQQTGLAATMFDRMLHEAADDHFDHESFWREQVATWIAKYEWRRREGPEVTKDELDKEIEEWMAQRMDKSFASTQDLEQDLSHFMSGRGIDMQTRQQLDHDMDEYWARKGIGTTTDDDTDNTSTVTSIHSDGRSVSRNRDYSEKDLDQDLADYLNKRNGTAGGTGTDDQSNGQTGDKQTDDSDTQSLSSAYSSLIIKKKQISNNGPKPLTPQERMRRRLTPVVQTPVTASALDQELDSYFARQEMLRQQAVKEEEEQQRQQTAVGEGDRFADCGDFDELDEELEWQE